MCIDVFETMMLDEAPAQAKDIFRWPGGCFVAHGTGIQGCAAPLPSIPPLA